MCNIKHFTFFKTLFCLYVTCVRELALAVWPLFRTYYSSDVPHPRPDLCPESNPGSYAKENVWSPEMVWMMWLCCALIFTCQYILPCVLLPAEVLSVSEFQSINSNNKPKEAWFIVMWLPFQRHRALLWCISSRFRVQCEGIIQCEPNGTLHIYCIRQEHPSVWIATCREN